MKSGKEKTLEEIEGNLYVVLGVKPESTTDDIKKAYKRKALELHPDRNFGKPAEELKQQAEEFIKVKQAYDVLSDPIQRNEHDDYLRAEFAKMAAERSMERTHIVDPFPPRVSCVLIWSPPDFRLRYFDNIAEGLDMVRGLADSGRVNSNFKLVENMREVEALTAEGKQAVFQSGGRTGAPQIMIEIAMSKAEAAEMFMEIGSAKKSGNQAAENGLLEKLNQNIHGARIVVPHFDRSAEHDFRDFVEENKDGERIAIFSRHDLENESVLSNNRKPNLLGQSSAVQSKQTAEKKQLKGKENVLGKLASWVTKAKDKTATKVEAQSLAIEASGAAKEGKPKPETVLQIEAGNSADKKPKPQSVQAAARDAKEDQEFRSLKNSVETLLAKPESSGFRNLKESLESSTKTRHQYKDVLRDMAKEYLSELNTASKTGRNELVSKLQALKALSPESYKAAITAARPAQQADQAPKLGK